MQIIKFTTGCVAIQTGGGSREPKATTQNAASPGRLVGRDEPSFAQKLALRRFPLEQPGTDGELLGASCGLIGTSAYGSFDRELTAGALFPILLLDRRPGP